MSVQWNIELSRKEKISFITDYRDRLIAFSDESSDFRSVARIVKELKWLNKELKRLKAPKPRDHWKKEIDKPLKIYSNDEYTIPIFRIPDEAEA